jgi:DNA-binding transcriptional LysR family regulator
LVPGLRLSDTDLRHLRAFASVVEYGGLSAAARELNQSLASLSRSITALESRFRVKLCTRGRSGFAVTPQGREVYGATQGLFANVLEFEHTVQNVARAVRGKIRVGLIDNLLSNPASAIHLSIGTFIRAHPDIYFELSILPKPAIESAVREDSVDIGVTGDPLFFKSLTYTEFSTESHQMYVAAGSATARQLAAGERLGRVPYVRRRYKAPAFEIIEKRYELRATATASSLEAATMLVAAGAGIGILPTHYVARLPHLDLKIVPIPESPIMTQLYVVSRGNDSAIANEFIACLVAGAARAHGTPERTSRQVRASVGRR